MFNFFGGGGRPQVSLKVASAKATSNVDRIAFLDNVKSAVRIERTVRFLLLIKAKPSRTFDVDN